MCSCGRHLSTEGTWRRSCGHGPDRSLSPWCRCPLAEPSRNCVTHEMPFSFQDWLKGRRNGSKTTCLTRRHCLDQLGRSFPMQSASVLWQMSKIALTGFVLYLSPRWVPTGGVGGGKDGNYTNIPDTHLHSVHLSGLMKRQEMLRQRKEAC